ncbi:acyl-CoA thioesterase [Engelhardtia mirabilis]|uniref:Acyl-CoA thioester hydrolase YbgC n=1 Tax=Engelhardtia mirabilis TaxID=2528011 RepID=A0A518BQP8_9BACT|nr:Acyl-CoA thioester hydrolase YbgC [Planctomycetes bacterium Pla133]QDV03597.1 Acyl-CoA thioester hydrolase YbgC [Planctomycetes bacterium Pla86]
MDGTSPESIELPHRHRIRVRYAETDQMGRVHHANYLLYLEEARTTMMEQLGWPYDELERSGLGLVVRSTDLRYRAAGFYGDRLVVETVVASIRGASVELSYAVRRESNGERLATAGTQLACVNLRSDPPAVQMLPEGLRRAFEACRGEL